MSQSKKKKKSTLTSKKLSGLTIKTDFLWVYKCKQRSGTKAAPNSYPNSKQPFLTTERTHPYNSKKVLTASDLTAGDCEHTTCSQHSSNFKKVWHHTKQVSNVIQSQKNAWPRRSDWYTCPKLTVSTQHFLPHWLALWTCLQNNCTAYPTATCHPTDRPGHTRTCSGSHFCTSVPLQWLTLLIELKTTRDSRSTPQKIHSEDHSPNTSPQSHPTALPARHLHMPIADSYQGQSAA